MFIAIILYGDTLNKTIKFNKNVEESKLAIPLWGGFEAESQSMISWGILGISVSSILLAISIVAQNKGLELPFIFYIIELIVFLIALITSAVYELIINYFQKRSYQNL